MTFFLAAIGVAVGVVGVTFWLAKVAVNREAAQTFGQSSPETHQVKLRLPRSDARSGPETSGVMNVTRVHTASGSRIEPPLDQSWDELTKLQWKAAVVAGDTGLPIRVTPAQYWIGKRRIHGCYDISTGDSITGPNSFNQAWSLLNGIQDAGQALIRSQEPAADTASSIPDQPGPGGAR